jgi:hypothetical protein
MSNKFNPPNVRDLREKKIVSIMDEKAKEDYIIMRAEEDRKNGDLQFPYFTLFDEEARKLYFNVREYLNEEKKEDDGFCSEENEENNIRFYKRIKDVNY